MDWGISGVIVGFIAFISGMITDTRVKRLASTVTEQSKVIEEQAAIIKLLDEKVKNCD